MGEKRNAYRLLVGKPEGRRPLGRSRRRRVDNIKIDLGEIGWGGVLTGLVWLRRGKVESSCEFGNGPLSFIKRWETIEWPNI
jgi:hypothetical protein